MIKKTNRVLAMVVLWLSPTLFAGASKHPAPPAMSKEFAPLKNLVGSWEGTTSVNGKPEPVTVVYELTSGGTALVEKLLPGTPQEMVSVYHKAGKSLAMTHFCMRGNQPHMQLKKATAKTLAFEVVTPVGLTSLKEGHMHGLTLTFEDSDTLKHEWVNFEKGKEVNRAVFDFKRKVVRKKQ